MALFRNFFASIGCLTVLVILLVGSWLYRAEIKEWWLERNEIVMSEPSAELAAAAEEKMEAIADGSASGEVRLSETELQSYMQYRVAGRLPDGIYNPAVDLRDSTMSLSAELDFNRLAASSSAAEGLQRFMGDSARVMTELYPTIAAPGEAAVTVLSLQAGMVPVPPMLIPMVLDQVLEQFELESGGGRVVAFPIPEDVRAIRIENEELVLIRGG